MKKFTKRLTMIVAILLSLVLLTSSIVSTTLAKYVVTKSAEVTATLQKFGLEVALSVNSGFSTTETKKLGDTLEVTINNIKLQPGNDEPKYKNMITASITQSATVAADLIIEVTVEEDDSSNFNVLATNFKNYENCRYLPIGVCVAGTDVITPYTKYAATDDIGDKIQTAIAAQIKNTVGGASTNVKSVTQTGGKIEGSIAANQAVSVSNIGIGFYWPYEYTQVEGSNEIGTWIAKNEPTFTITYKITVQQNADPNT